MEDGDNYGKIEGEGWKMVTTMGRLRVRTIIYKMMTTIMRKYEKNYCNSNSINNETQQELT